MEKVLLLDVCNVYQPQTISTKQFVPDGKYKVYGANGPIGRYNEYNHECAEILMACRGATCGVINVSEPFSWINGNAMVIQPNGRVPINKKYLKYYMQYVPKDKIITGTAQPQITRQNLKDFQISICDEITQERIVARIEELFSQLDAGVETLKKTKEQLAVYRQAVLKEAFEGKLTSEWRETNAYDINSVLSKINEEKEKRRKSDNFHLEYDISLAPLPGCWRWIFIGDISKGPEYGTSQKSEKKGLIPVIRMGNLQNGKIKWDDLVYSSDNEEIRKYRLVKGDVLFNRTNSPELVGKTAIYQGEHEAIFAGYLIKINQIDCINPAYLTYYLNSFTARNYGNKVKTDGVNQSNINSKKLCSYPFPICSIEEQTQVVYELETRLSACEDIEKTVDIALQQAEAMRQSILKTAFEGEL